VAGNEQRRPAGATANGVFAMMPIIDLNGLEISNAPRQTNP
jgi:hypothetical protein